MWAFGKLPRECGERALSFFMIRGTTTRNKASFLPPAKRGALLDGALGDGKLASMDKHSHIFHLAIPCKDLNETVDFYEQAIGARVARRYADRVTLDFFGDQVVLHLSPESIDSNPKMYPRHFGMTFKTRESFDTLLEKVKSTGATFFQDPFVRFKDKPEEHHTFFLKDPSNNLIEVKYYADPDFIY